MTKEINLKWGEEASALGLSRLSREKLYGRKQKIVVANDDVVCRAALLTTDGATLVPSNGTTSAYITREFDTIERKELQARDPETQELLEMVGSTLGKEQTLEGPVPLQELGFQAGGQHSIGSMHTRGSRAARFPDRRADHGIRSRGDARIHLQRFSPVIDHGLT